MTGRRVGRSHGADLRTSRRILAAAVSSAAVAALLRERSSRRRAVAAGALLFWSTGTHLRLAVRDIRAERYARLNSGIRSALVALLRSIVEVSGFDVFDVGVSLFIAERHPGRPWSRRLRRIEHVRSASLPPRSGVTWSKGKGIIGRAWADNAVLFADLSAMYNDFKTEADWAVAPKELRMGLKWHEVERLRERYSGVIAVPVVSPTSAHTIGIMTFDTLAQCHFGPLMDDNRLAGVVVDLMSEAAALVADLLEDTH